MKKIQEYRSLFKSKKQFQEGSYTTIEMVRDGFIQGEWSIYKRSYDNGRVTYESYLVGLTKKREAQEVVDMLKIELKLK